MAEGHDPSFDARAAQLNAVPLPDADFDLAPRDLRASLIDYKHASFASAGRHCRQRNDGCAFRAVLLKPGMFARVTLITRRTENAVVIPRDVILGGKIDQHYVYVVEDGIAHKRFVNLGVTESGRCEITDGLKVGDTLVVNGMHYLTDEASVEVVRIEDIK